MCSGRSRDAPPATSRGREPATAIRKRQAIRGHQASQNAGSLAFATVRKSRPLLALRTADDRPTTGRLLRPQVPRLWAGRARADTGRPRGFAAENMGAVMAWSAWPRGGSTCAIDAESGAVLRRRSRRCIGGGRHCGQSGSWCVLWRAKEGPNLSDERYPIAWPD